MERSLHCFRGSALAASESSGIRKALGLEGRRGLLLLNWLRRPSGRVEWKRSKPKIRDLKLSFVGVLAAGD